MNKTQEEINYIIVHEEGSMDNMAIKVNDMIDKGYEPIGGLCNTVVDSAFFTKTVFYQAMILKAPAKRGRKVGTTNRKPIQA